MRTPDPCALVVFGASGDLTGRKIVPALYNLRLAKLLPERFALVGFARTETSSQEFARQLRGAAEEHSRTRPVDDGVWASFGEHIHYICAGTHDHAAYERLARELEHVDEERGTEGNRLYYLATPPSAYPEVAALLGEAGLAKPGKGWARVVVEKPFGRDLGSARELNACLHACFDEPQVFRIDHYLGKETVQNLFVFRFSNGIFEPVWNRRYVDHVQITVAESIGVEHRGAYYEEAGAIRDILQNHLLQLLALCAMEPPVDFEADALRDEKVKVLRAVQVSADHVVRGQYAGGVAEGTGVPGYGEEPGVGPGSRTETYVALKAFVDNWRWAGVPFYLRTGKRLPRRATEIAVAFKPAPFLPFVHTAVESLEANLLVIRIQPNEGIALRFGAKVPEPGEMRIRNVEMDFDYEETFTQDAPDAYERLLLDAMLGDATLFMRRDEVEMQWEIVEPLLDAGVEPARYPAGSWGPAEANRLIERDQRRWREP